MKISIDGINLITISDHQKKVISNDINYENIEKELKDAIEWCIKCKYSSSLNLLYKEWLDKIKKRYPSIPTDDEELANLIISQEDYKDKASREMENKEQKDCTFSVI